MPIAEEGGARGTSRLGIQENVTKSNFQHLSLWNRIESAEEEYKTSDNDYESNLYSLKHPSPNKRRGDGSNYNSRNRLSRNNSKASLGMGTSMTGAAIVGVATSAADQIISEKEK